MIGITRQGAHQDDDSPLHDLEIPPRRPRPQRKLKSVKKLNTKTD